MSDETSPRPWRWTEPVGPGSTFLPSGAEKLVDVNGREVVGGSAVTVDGLIVLGFAHCSDADARLIVTAVNHHDELVAALNSVLTGIDFTLPSPRLPQHQALWNRVLTARELLARIAKERGE